MAAIATRSRRPVLDVAIGIDDAMAGTTSSSSCNTYSHHIVSDDAALQVQL